jgi:salicylate biosynthesis isochorismate synthase/menaquinone-specific isochorismate synthase
MAEVSTALPELAVAELPAPLELRRPDFAWSRPGLSFSASGEVEKIEGVSLRTALETIARGPSLPGAPGPWFGAAAFHGSPGPAWEGFAPLSFRLPSLLSWSTSEPGGRHFAVAFGPRAKQALDEARRMQLASLPRPSGVKLVVQRGEKERWAALVAAALAEIRTGRLQKVVLARAVDVESDEPLDPQVLFRSLSARYPGCRSFLLRGGDAVFIGASPELLCLVAGDRVETEAIAGSAAPGQETPLARSGKDLREHAQVVEHIVARLRPLSQSLRLPPGPEVLALANVLHLRTPVEARLAPGRTAADVATALHPTPAVCGAPQAAALRFLAEHEGLDRGLYAGVVGWAGPSGAELAVALRCAVVRGRRARLFVGAGIVEGSQPAAEWEETQLKARALLGALGAEP